MNNKQCNPPRLLIDISEEQNTMLLKYLKWGVKAPLFRVIIDDLLLALSDDKTRDHVIAAVMSGRLKVVDWSRLLLKEEKNEC